MAIPKYPQSHIRQQRKRTTWTRFRLPAEQKWPTWLVSDSNEYLGPLAGIAGCEKVRLGRMVESPEHAAFIILWESADALQNFQQSDTCAEFLQGLGCDEKQPLPRHFESLQWESGFCMGDNMIRGDDFHGRITLTKLIIPHNTAGGTSDRQEWRRVLIRAFSGFLPEGCRDVAVLQAYRWQAIAWRDGGGVGRSGQQQIQQGESSASNSSHGGETEAIAYHLFRWNGNGAGPELEETLAQDPAARESWANVVTATMPPVASWGQERWDIEIAPCCIDSSGDEDDGEVEAEHSEAATANQGPI